jgi:hypothetical protein
MQLIRSNRFEMSLIINDGVQRTPVKIDNIPMGFQPFNQAEWATEITAQNNANPSLPHAPVSLPNNNGSINISEEDTTTIMEQTECTLLTAQNAMRSTGGDVITCIMDIDKYVVAEDAPTTSVEKENIVFEMADGVTDCS